MPPPTRDRLVRAATRLLARDGYRGLSIQDVLDDAAATSGSLYHHFPGGKEELAAAAIRESAAALQAGLARSIDEVGPRDAVAVLCERSARGMQASGWQLGCPVGTPAADGIVASEAVAAAVRDAIDGWTSLLAEALVADGAAAEEATASARWILAAYEGAMLLSRTHRDAATMQVAASRLVAEVERVTA